MVARAVAQALRHVVTLCGARAVAQARAGSLTRAGGSSVLTAPRCASPSVREVTTWLRELWLKRSGVSSRSAGRELLDR